jgi:hypothetical protein
VQAKGHKGIDVQLKAKVLGPGLGARDVEEGVDT